MKVHTTLVLAFAVFCLSGCGFLGGGSCPDNSDPEEVPLESGVFELSESASQPTNVFTEGADHRLVVNREDGTAKISFTTSDGRNVVVTYAATGESGLFLD